MTGCCNSTEFLHEIHSWHLTTQLFPSLYFISDLNFKPNFKSSLRASIQFEGFGRALPPQHTPIQIPHSRLFKKKIKHMLEDPPADTRILLPFVTLHQLKNGKSTVPLVDASLWKNTILLPKVRKISPSSPANFFLSPEDEACCLLFYPVFLPCSSITLPQSSSPLKEKLCYADSKALQELSS